MKDTAAALGFKGTWKFLGKHWKFGLDEYRGAFSKAYFLKRLRKLIPALQMEDIVAARCGIRAMALGPDGEMLDDFRIEKHGNAMHVINSPSPAATASLAYGNEIATQAVEYFNLK
jgi:L-2-hydroxyglutarate oxidase LhgO